MAKLRAVKPSIHKKPKPKVLVYGGAGVGKTWASLGFPSVYYIDTEGGAEQSHYQQKLIDAGGAYMGRAEGALSFDTVIEQVEALATKKHDFKTIVIDSITKVFNETYAREEQRLGHNEYGAARKPAVTAMRRLVSWLMRVDMNVILIAHEKALFEKGEEIGKTFDCWDKLLYELDLTLAIKKQGPDRIARVVKSRIFDFPDGSSFPWSYEEFSNRYGQDVIESDEKEQVELISEEDLDRLRNQIALLNVTQEQQDKWLTAAKCESFAEMDAEKASQLIHMLNEKLTENK